MWPHGIFLTASTGRALSSLKALEQHVRDVQDALFEREFALAGTVLKDLMTEPLGIGTDGKPVWIGDVWPTSAEIQAT